MSAAEVIAWAVALSIAAIALIAYSYFDWKKSQATPKKNRATNPFLLAAVIGFVLTAIIWIPYMVGAVGEENKTRLLWINAVVVGVVFFMFFQQYKRAQPKPLDEIQEKIIIPHLLHKYHVRKPSGESTYWSTIWQKRSSEVVNDVEKVTDIFYLRFLSERMGEQKFLVLYDPLNKTKIEEHPNPPQTLMSSLLSREPSEVGGMGVLRAGEKLQRDSVRVENNNTEVTG